MKLSAHCMLGGNIFHSNLSWLFFNDTYPRDDSVFWQYKCEVYAIQVFQNIILFGHKTEKTDTLGYYMRN
jgi:hypothetical protein